MVPAIEELWNAWEIHCLILVSLFLQVFLFLFGGLRRRSSDWLLRSVLWLAYVSADSVAVFVLGHLAVHASQPRHQLMSFWALFILVAVAGYVVVKASWPDRRLFAAMVLMFLCGCYKYGERIIILYSANPEQLREWSNDVQSKKELIRIKDEADRWDLISTVWAEMVYYIAPRCGGTFHYVHLSSGGEFITHILVLMYYLGPLLPPSDA
ncbi:hypothetical protein PR202_gn00801 [Eleusine coracana subsp. coracana]|uniref:DUF4220 domain-containing protein n=1 Tax=Eleusine coracana subsp. coracana TaxID=191504 RepID=A0AAV5G0L2_ELECO|nr:hypothetical protein PR202_gn00801 [Eleusine coracana subsp. coracana]